jgi:preprotein translocase subunit SecF
MSEETSVEEPTSEHAEPRAQASAEGRSGPLRRLYRGETRIDFIGKGKVWFALSLAIILAGLVAIGVRGLNFGIEFRGGSSWEVQVSNVSVAQATDAVSAAGLQDPTVQILGGRTLQVQANIKDLSSDAQQATNTKVIAAMAALGHTSPNQVSTSSVGASWGSEVTSRALWALALFFVAVVIYISFRFEPKMALAAVLAMVHDLAITVGIYALFGFQVTPDTVVAILTILGYSLYDTVVVFDRVRDNVKSLGASGRFTYSDLLNLSMNQTLARSINTSLVAVLPVLAVLVVGAEILGATTLLNYGVALFVGLVAGAYSSIFIASPLLGLLKEREQRWIAVRSRLEARGARGEVVSAAQIAAESRETARSSAGTASGVIRPGSAAARVQAGAPLSQGAPRGRKQKSKKRR